MSVDFEHPWVLLLLALALLPLLPRRGEELAFSHLPWLPADRLGRLAGFAWRALAVLAIACLAIALAGPGQPETREPRTGSGAEILLLIDRSRSMDEPMPPAGWRDFDPLTLRARIEASGEPKAKAARELLARFVAQRPHDRFALMFFSANPLRVMPFTQHDEVVQAAIRAGGVGRGLSDTEVGRALIAAIGEFDQRAYTGSRIILLVSDGGAQLDADTRRRIRAGLLRNRVTLDWLYLRAYNRPELDAPGEASAAIPEVALHRFFESLPTPYHAYQAESPQDLAEAVAEVGRQQNFPLEFEERIPRRDLGRHFIAAAAAACALLVLLRATQLRSWR